MFMARFIESTFKKIRRKRISRTDDYKSQFDGFEFNFLQPSIVHLGDEQKKGKESINRIKTYMLQPS